MSRPQKSRYQSWKSCIREAWRSTLSWMRWRQRKQLRLAQERRQQILDQEQLLLLMAPVVRLAVREVLLEALTPLAQALSRQDSLLLQQTHRLEWKAETLEEMVLELLQQQPTPGSRMRDELGVQSPT